MPVRAQFQQTTKGRVMKTANMFKRTTMTVLLVLPLLLAMSFSASAADKVYRIITLTAVSAEAQQKDIEDMIPSFAKVYKAAKGCESVTFLTDSATLATGSASVWASRADLDTFVKSPDYLALRAKLKVLTKGTPREKIYKISEPK
jgi:quinol monooxygenase YgiN